MTKRSALKDVDFSARGHQAWLDWWVWGQLSTKGKFLFVPEKATRWRLHPDSNNQRFVDSVNRRKYFVLFRRDLFKLLLENIRKIRGIRNKLRLISTALGNHIDYLRIKRFD